MTTTPPVSARQQFWKTVLLFGAIHFLVMSLGIFVESGSGGCMFIIPAYFMILPLVLPILILRRVGAGTAVFLPYAILGFYPTYYFELPKMFGLWGVVGWCLMGPLVGLVADLTYKFLPQSVSERWRAIIVGAVSGAAIFATTYVALATFYREPDLGAHFRYFTTNIYFSLPWLILNGGFAGYTAYALNKRV